MNVSECLEIGLYQAAPTRFVLGCDEVGRGPLAGPVTAACVAFPPALDARFPLFAALDDSKKLTPKKRETLVPAIEAAAAAYAIVDLPPETIDRLNILRASLTAMRMAVEAVVQKLKDAGLLTGRDGAAPIRRSLFDETPASADANIFVIVDGNKEIPDLVYPQAACVKGDGRSWSIAAASVLAKVHRDALMVEYDTLYPGYGFASHAGYPTKAHREAVKKLGFCPIHRRSFQVR